MRDYGIVGNSFKFGICTYGLKKIELSYLLTSNLVQMLL